MHVPHAAKAAIELVRSRVFHALLQQVRPLAGDPLVAFVATNGRRHTPCLAVVCVCVARQVAVGRHHHPATPAVHAALQCFCDVLNNETTASLLATSFVGGGGGSGGGYRGGGPARGRGDGSGGRGRGWASNGGRGGSGRGRGGTTAAAAAGDLRVPVSVLLPG